VTLVDTCIWLDVFSNDATWADWSQAQLDIAFDSGGIVINPIIYAELSVGFDDYRMLDKALSSLEVRIRNLMRPSLFLAGKAFRQYRKRGGTRASVLPDFFIGAQAAIQGWPVLTRDVTRIGGYFPTVTLLSP